MRHVMAQKSDEVRKYIYSYFELTLNKSIFAPQEQFLSFLI